MNYHIQILTLFSIYMKAFLLWENRCQYRLKNNKKIYYFDLEFIKHTFTFDLVSRT